MSDARNGTLATFIPFTALLLFWEFVVRGHHWADASSGGFINFKKIVSVALPIFLLIWAIVGTSLTYKYTSERRELRRLASKDTTHFVVTPVSDPLSASRIPKDTARKAADKISFSKLKNTIDAIKKKEYDSKDYEAFLKELQEAYGSTGVVRSAIPTP